MARTSDRAKKLKSKEVKQDGENGTSKKNKRLSKNVEGYQENEDSDSNLLEDDDMKEITKEESSDDEHETSHTEESGEEKNNKKKRKGKSKKSKKKVKTDRDDEDNTDEDLKSEFEVEKILDICIKKDGSREFLVRWKNFLPEDDTWEPEEHLECQDLISEFMKTVDPKSDEKNNASNKKGKTPTSKEVKKNIKTDSNEKDNVDKEDEKSQYEESEEEKTNQKKKRGKSQKSKEVKKKLKVESNEEDDVDEKDDKSQYEVEKIVDVHFKKNGGREFLIRWKHYKPKDDTWEPEEHLDCQELISDFMKKVDFARSSTKRELRENRVCTSRFVPEQSIKGLRSSHRHKGRQRTTYFGTE